ncbi:hypothetical protein E3N88_39767 [Mikania micrantha]|uniref:Uncharacterized protein n=1 Tax=Mikania micrantha TaxID=192012 RepID=A0A5N6LKP9_9ASTR|nr:hypothetical protein E3N88_39767 [Mikania micrantha]
MTPRPIAVRDGHQFGPSRYAKPERENLNSPKRVAVRDDRSSSTTAVRGVFREQNEYFKHREAPFEAFGDWSELRSTIHHRERPRVAVRVIPDLLNFYFVDSRSCKVVFIINLA